MLDFLPVLHSELEARGLHYDVVREQPELDLEAPAGAPYFRDVRLTSRDVILARRGEVAIHIASSANFAAASTVPSPVGPFAVRASWVAADVTVNNRSFRFVTTHLEPFEPFVRTAQAAELVVPGGPAGPSQGSVVLVGDMNSDPADPGPHGAAFDVLAEAGFADTWVQANGSLPDSPTGSASCWTIPTPRALTPASTTCSRAAPRRRPGRRSWPGSTRQPHPVGAVAIRSRGRCHDDFALTMVPNRTFSSTMGYRSGPVQESSTRAKSEDRWL